MIKRTINTVEYGVWLDHKKAIIGYFDTNRKFINKTIYSGIETRLRFKGETTDKIRSGTVTRNRETFKQNKLVNDLKKFCGEVASDLNNMSALLILGPGDTKFKLAEIIKNNKARKDVWVKVEAADKMLISEFKTRVMAQYV